MSEKLQNKDTSFYVKIAVVFLFMFGFRFLPPFGQMTSYGMAVLGILIGMILGWTFDPQSMSWVSLLGLTALATTAYQGGAYQALATVLADANLMLMCLTMILVGALMAAKVDTWMISKMMNLPFAKGKPWVLTSLLVFSPFILGYFISPNALLIFLFPIYAKLFQAAGYKAGDKYVIHVFIGASLAAIAGPYAIPFIGMPLVFGSLIQAYLGDYWTFSQYYITVTVFSFILSIGYILFMRLLRCDASKIVNVDMSVFGSANSLDNYQKSLLWCMLAFLVGSILISVFGNFTNAFGVLCANVGVYGWTIFIMAVMMIVKVDGKRLMDFNASTRYGFSWDLILLIGAATIVGTTLNTAETGFAATLSGFMMPILAGLSPLMIVIVLCIFALILTNIANNMAILMITLTLASTLIYSGLPINAPMLGAGLMLMCMMGLVLPSSSLYGAILHTTPMTTTSSLIKNGILCLLYIIVMFLIVFVPLANMVF